jgi:hypothetical protein
MIVLMGSLDDEALEFLVQLDAYPKAARTDCRKSSSNKHTN